MIKLKYLSYTSGGIYEIIPAIAPGLFILLYIFIINKIPFTRRFLIIFSAIYFITSMILGIIIASNCMPAEAFTDLSVSWYSLYVLFIYTGVFPVIQHYFFKRWMNNDQKFDSICNPINASHIIEYHHRPKTVLMIGILYRYSLLACFILLIISYFNFVILGIPFASIYVFYPTILIVILSIIFFITMAYLRLLARCPNCHLEIYVIRDNYTDFLVAAKHGIKFRIIECCSCHAKYILDRKISYEHAKQLISNIDKNK